MRGAMLIGLVVVLLIIGILVMKNMGADKTGAAQKSQTKAYIDKAKSVEDDANKRLKDIQKQAQAVD